MQARYDVIGNERSAERNEARTRDRRLLVVAFAAFAVTLLGLCVVFLTGVLPALLSGNGEELTETNDEEKTEQKKEGRRVLFHRQEH